jgi:hypothetical protein
MSLYQPVPEGVAEALEVLEGSSEEERNIILRSAVVLN